MNISNPISKFYFKFFLIFNLCCLYKVVKKKKKTKWKHQFIESWNIYKLAETSVQWLLVPYLISEEVTIGKGLQIEATDVNWHLARRGGNVEGREGCNLQCRELTGNCYYKYLDTLEGNSHGINQYSSTVNILLCPAIGFLLTVKYIVSEVKSYCV